MNKLSVVPVLLTFASAGFGSTVATVGNNNTSFVAPFGLAAPVHFQEWLPVADILSAFGNPDQLSLISLGFPTTNAGGGNYLGSLEIDFSLLALPPNGNIGTNNAIVFSNAAFANAFAEHAPLVFALQGYTLTAANTGQLLVIDINIASQTLSSGVAFAADTASSGGVWLGSQIPGVALQVQFGANTESAAPEPSTFVFVLPTMGLLYFAVRKRRLAR